MAVIYIWQERGAGTLGAPLRHESGCRSRPNDKRFSGEPRARRHCVNEQNPGPRGSSAASAC